VTATLELLVINFGLEVDLEQFKLINVSLSLSCSKSLFIEMPFGLLDFGWFLGFG
jgi:hypothetical protein